MECCVNTNNITSNINEPKTHISIKKKSAFYLIKIFLYLIKK